MMERSIVSEMEADYKKKQIINIFTYHNHCSYRYTVRRLKELLTEKFGPNYSLFQIRSILKELIKEGIVKSKLFKKETIYYTQSDGEIKKPNRRAGVRYRPVLKRIF